MGEDEPISWRRGRQSLSKVSISRVFCDPYLCQTGVPVRVILQTQRTSGLVLTRTLESGIHFMITRPEASVKFVLRIQRRPLLTCARLELTIVTLMPIVPWLLQVSHAPANLVSVGTVLRVQILTSAQLTPITAMPKQLVLTPPVASLVLATLAT